MQNLIRDLKNYSKLLNQFSEDEFIKNALDGINQALEGLAMQDVLSKGEGEYIDFITKRGNKVKIRFYDQSSENENYNSFTIAPMRVGMSVFAVIAKLQKKPNYYVL